MLNGPRIWRNRRPQKGDSPKMKQVIRKGLKEIIIDDVPDPVLTPHHLVVRPLFSLISSGTETARTGGR